MKAFPYLPEFLTNFRHKRRELLVELSTNLVCGAPMVFVPFLLVLCLCQFHMVMAFFLALTSTHSKAREYKQSFKTYGIGPSEISESDLTTWLASYGWHITEMQAMICQSRKQSYLSLDGKRVFNFDEVKTILNAYDKRLGVRLPSLQGRECPKAYTTCACWAMIKQTKPC